MRKDQQDRLLMRAQNVVNDADNDGTSQVIVDREVFDGLRAVVKEISDDAVREIEELLLPAKKEWDAWQRLCHQLKRVKAVTSDDLNAPSNRDKTPGDAVFAAIREWGEELVKMRLESMASFREESRLKPSPLETCADGAAEWEIDAKMAEARRASLFARHPLPKRTIDALVQALSAKPTLALFEEDDGCLCGEATGTRPAFHPLCLYCLNGLGVEEKPEEESRPKRVIGCCYICGAEKVEGQENEFVWPDEDDEIQSPACERHLKESRASLFRVQLPDEGEERPQKDWIFTFGYDHKDSQGNRLWKRFVRIHGTFHEARRKMLERFGRAWAFQYESEKEAGVAEWGLEEYKIDEQTEKESR